MSLVEIRTGTKDDAEQVATLHTASWRKAYARLLPQDFLDGPLAEQHRTLWKDRLDAPASSSCLLLAVADGAALRGFIYLTPQPNGRVLVDNLHAHPAHVGTGVGHRLLHRGFAWAAAHYPGQDVCLNVLSGNARAIAFYERQGGRRVGEHVLTFRGSEIPELEYVWPASHVDEDANEGE